MNKSVFKIVSNKKLTNDVFEMKLIGDTAEIKRPGQFVEVELKERFLRRPISVCNVSGDTLTLIYKTVGVGTEQMSQMGCGESLDLLTGLGNGYEFSNSGNMPVLIGGGVGVPPMYLLAKRLLEQGKKPTMIMGFNKKSEIFYEDEFKALGMDVLVTTADGSYGIKGFVTDGMRTLDAPSFVYACGPLPMLRAVYAETEIPGEYSFEQRMGCGFGACMGCTTMTKNGPKRICKDGPILSREEIIW